MKTKDEHRHTSTNNNMTNPKHIISTHGIWVSNLLGGFQITMWTTQKIATPHATNFFFFCTPSDSSDFFSLFQHNLADHSLVTTAEIANTHFSTSTKRTVSSFFNPFLHLYFF